MLGVNTGTRRLRVGALRAKHHCDKNSSTIPRKDLIAAARDAGRGLGLRSTLRQVLGELVACYGEQRIESGLIVWPSNDYLCQKTGLGERAIRRCIRELTDLELLRPVDSPNRKRFAVRDRSGEIIDAYGFDLMPIYGRRGEFEAAVEAQKATREARKRHFDAVTICRKACEEAIRSLQAYFPALDLADVMPRFAELWGDTPERSAQAMRPGLLKDWLALQDQIEAMFEQACNEEKESASARPSSLHKEQDNGSSSETYKRTSEEVRAEAPGPGVSIELVLRACPAVASYTRSVEATEDLIDVGKYLRGSIGAHADAWAEASRGLGELHAAVLVIYVLQLHENDQASGRNAISNPGGLFRTLARKAIAGEFFIDRELRSLARRRIT